MATIPTVVAEKQKQLAPQILDEDLEDTSPLLKHDEEELREVNEFLWWAIDAVIGFVATYLTHDDTQLNFIQRIFASLGMIAVGFLLCKVYFTSGLTRPLSGQPPSDKWWHMLFTHVGNIFFLWEWAISLYNMFAGYIEEGTSPIKATVSVALGFYLAIWLCDFIAGLVHWFGDTVEMYFFDYHHRDPRYMTRQSYVHHCWDSIALALILSPIIPGLRSNPILTTVRLVAVQANEAHMWSHCTSREIPPIIAFLQKLTIILSWKAHKNHHKPPHLIDYCVFNGWANPVFNKILPGPITNFVERNIRDNPRWHQLKRILDT